MSRNTLISSGLLLLVPAVLLAGEADSGLVGKGPAAIISVRSNTPAPATFRKLELDVELNAQQERIPRGRYFALVFRITHYNEYLKDGLDHIFEKVLNPRDQLLVFINNRSQFFKSLENKGSVKMVVDRLISQESEIARKKMLLYLKEVESAVNKHNMEMKLAAVGGGQNFGVDTREFHTLIERYFAKFLEIW